MATGGFFKRKFNGRNSIRTISRQTFNAKKRKLMIDKIPKKEIERVYQQVFSTIYGQAVGDALGLLTESLTKADAKKNFGCVNKELELICKRMVTDRHRQQWDVGDWTDDTDMLIILMRCIVNNMGEISSVPFAKMLREWAEQGFPELGDKSGVGICPHFKSVIYHPQFLEQPEKAAEIVWRKGGNYVACNLILCFAPILGIHYYNALGKVIKNALHLCAILQPDPRCQAACVAMSVTIAMLIQREPKHLKRSGDFDPEAIITDSFDYASKLLNLDSEVLELQTHMFTTSLKQLNLDEPGKTRYIYKTLGVGMWALRQKDFRKALQEVVMEGGDADANAAAAGTILGCKLGFDSIPKSWMEGLIHRGWMEEELDKYLYLLEGEGNPRTTFETVV